MPNDKISRKAFLTHLRQLHAQKTSMLNQLYEIQDKDFDYVDAQIKDTNSKLGLLEALMLTLELFPSVD